MYTLFPLLDMSYGQGYIMPMYQNIHLFVHLGDNSINCKTYAIIMIKRENSNTY